jgi:hypothetical protein
MKSLATYLPFAATLVTAAYAIEIDSSSQLTAGATTQANPGKKWKSGEVMTHETFQYGKFIAKIKGDDKLGTCTSFFSFWKGDPDWSKDKWSEIDTLLVPSAKNGTLTTNIVWEDGTANVWQANRDTIADPNDGWAIYEF